MSTTQFLAMSGGRRIAYRFSAGREPVLVFFPGYMSDMAGGKASALAAWAAAEGRACLLLDYAGCGESDGDFAEGTLTRWRDDAVALVESLAHGSTVLIGSSMGGWLMLLVAEALGGRVSGLIGIAAAPDFTEWGTSAENKAALAAGHTVYDDNPYGPAPTPTHPDFWADGQAQLRLNGAIAIDCPVRLLHGQRDAEVPWEVSLRLAAALCSADIQVTLVKDGDHRLSRPSDIALLLRTAAALLAGIEGS